MAPLIDISGKDYTRAQAFLNAGNIKYNIPQQKQIADLDTSNYLLLPQEFTGRDYSLAVSPARNSSNPAVEKAGKELEINYQNTARDSLNREFVGKNNWHESLKMNLALGGRTLDSREFIGLGNLLFQGMNGKVKVYDVFGKQIDKQDCQRYFEDIFKVQSPWRAEWIDTDFKMKDRVLYANSNHKLKNGILVPQSSEPLDKDSLRIDNQISLENYLANPTNQGLPKQNAKSGSFYYWAPEKDNNLVARSDAGGGWSVFGACRSPSNSGSDLGVRFAKQIE